MEAFLEKIILDLGMPVFSRLHPPWSRERKIVLVVVQGMNSLTKVQFHACQVVNTVNLIEHAYILGDKMNCTVGFVDCFLRVPLACLPCCQG